MWLMIWLLACDDKGETPSQRLPVDTGDGAVVDTGGTDTLPWDTGAGDTGAPPEPVDDPFADAVVSFSPGKAAGFGQDSLPDVVLGSPEGAGATAGSMDVLSLGCGGSLILALDDIILVDGEGPDLLVFENPFPGYLEPARVAVSDDLKTWSEWDCAADDTDGGHPGCAGVNPVLASSSNGVDATDPALAGGDAFDLADLGVEQARYVRITDAGVNDCVGITGGADIDAIAVVNGRSLDVQAAAR